MKKLFLIPLLLFPNSLLIAQEKVTGTRKQLIQEITSLRRELSDLKTMIDLNTISLSDTITTHDTLNYGTLYLDDLDDIEIPINTDSLLSIFYLQRSLLHNSQDEFFDIDSVNFVADLPDSVYIARLKALNSVITLPYNQTVKSSIVHYTQKMPTRIPAILGLAAYYMPIFEEIFDFHDLPLELKVMAIIESALNPTAVSKAKARGMWQFMLTAARQYDLTITSYVDERYDFIASGHAAAKYLKDAYTVFGDWPLAIASYNCGVGNVNKAIRRAGSREFWSVYPFLPRETRGYVPYFVAALYTLTYYKEHGIKPLRVEMPTHIDTFHVSKSVHFEQIADITGISVAELRDLNPQYLRDVIPGRPYTLRLPYHYSPLFAEKEQEIYAYKEEVYFSPILLGRNTSPATTDRNQLVHTVRSGETLGGIALRYRVNVSDLRYWNNIKGDLIRSGQRLMIYSGQAPPRATTSTTTIPSAASTTTTATNNQNVTYQWHTIQRGDTLWDLAQKYGVSLNDLLTLNGLNSRSKIIAGNKLKIKVL